MSGLLSDFRALKQSYPAAGSFVGFLIETQGLEVFKQLYPLLDPSSKAEELVGQRLEAMQAAWHALLAKHG